MLLVVKNQIGETAGTRSAILACLEPFLPNGKVVGDLWLSVAQTFWYPDIFFRTILWLFVSDGPDRSAGLPILNRHRNCR